LCKTFEREEDLKAIKASKMRLLRVALFGALLLLDVAFAGAQQKVRTRDIMWHTHTDYGLFHLMIGAKKIDATETNLVFMHTSRRGMDASS
jgi:hypothetical protein